MEKTKNSFRNVVIGVIGAAGVAIIGGIVFYLFLPAQYLTLDVNPSMELQTNRLNRVVSLVGRNEDARLLYAEKNNISLHELENHLEMLQANGGSDAHLEELEEAVDDKKDSIKDPIEEVAEKVAEAREAVEDAAQEEQEAQEIEQEEVEQEEIE